MRRLVLAFIWIGYKKGLKSTINACILAAIVFGTLDFFTALILPAVLVAVLHFTLRCFGAL